VVFDVGRHLEPTSLANAQRQFIGEHTLLMTLVQNQNIALLTFSGVSFARSCFDKIDAKKRSVRHPFRRRTLRKIEKQLNREAHISQIPNGKFERLARSDFFPRPAVERIVRREHVAGAFHFQRNVSF
jgi:hypothetical protein